MAHLPRLARALAAHHRLEGLVPLRPRRSGAAWPAHQPRAPRLLWTGSGWQQPPCSPANVCQPDRAPSCVRWSRPPGPAWQPTA